MRLLRKVPADVIDKVVYFLLGELRPPWEGVELGVSEKLAMKALSRATGVPVSEIEALYKKLGDLGEVARQVIAKSRKRKTILDFFSC